MDFEPKCLDQEFEIKENTVIINGATKEEYKKFYQDFKKGGGSPKQFLSIFGDFIEDCGFNLKNQEPVIRDTIFIRGLRDILPIAGISWTIWSDLDFTCNPQSVNVNCYLFIDGVKEKTDKLLRLTQICSYPYIVKLIPLSKGYQIDISDYCRLKIILTLLARTISATNEILFTLSDASTQLIRDMQKEDSKQFLNNLI